MRTTSGICPTVSCGLIAIIASGPVLAGPQPAMDFCSVLSEVRVTVQSASDQAQGGMLFIPSHMIGVFIPKEFYYTGQAQYEMKLFGVLTKAGSDAELARFGCRVEALPTVFSKVTVQQAAESRYQFDQEGDYVLTFELDGKPITRLPFSVSFKQSDDAFNPQTSTLIDGPWREWACMVLPNGDPDKNPLFRVWMRGGVFEPVDKKAHITASIVHEGDGVFTSRPVVVSAVESHLEWRKYDLDLAFHKDEGGGSIRTKNLLTKDGDYQVVLKRSDKVIGVYPYSVQAGKIVPHACQGLQYEPHMDYKAGRTPIDINTYEDLYWIKRASAEEARETLGAAPKKAAVANATDRAAWVVEPSIDPARPFEVVITDIKTRMDSHLAAGDGVIAFGTGATKGVAYVRVGETAEQSIPDGQAYSSKAFAVCGRKIVLTKDQQIFVYDTESGSTAAIPDNQVNLARGTLLRRMGFDGYLVAVVNDPKKVDDRAVIKVIDVSGTEPKVISITNAGLGTPDITSVAVDARLGKLAVGSKRKNGIYVGDVAPGATLRGFDLSGHDGFGDCRLLLSGGFAYYADASGGAKFRMLQIEAGKIITTAVWGKKGYAANGTWYAFDQDAPASGPDQYLFGSAPDGPSQPANSGQSILDSNGRFGQGASVAVSASGAVFVAGEKGLGSGEFLQVCTGGDWWAVLGADGKPLPATDVTMGAFVLAFRTGARNDTTVAYATFGENIAPPGSQ